MVFITWFGGYLHSLLEQELGSERHGPCWKHLHPKDLDVEVWVHSWGGCECGWAHGSNTFITGTLFSALSLGADNTFPCRAGQSTEMII